MKLQPTATPNRLHYLRTVELKGPYPGRHGVVANHCLWLGWVETVVRLQDGEVKRWKDLPQADFLLGDYEVLGQRLTADGLAVLDREIPNRSKVHA